MWFLRVHSVGLTAFAMRKSFLRLPGALNPSVRLPATQKSSEALSRFAIDLSFMAHVSGFML